MPLGIVSGRGVEDDLYKRPDILNTGSLSMEVGDDGGLKLQGRGGTRAIIREGSTTEEAKRWRSFFASSGKGIHHSVLMLPSEGYDKFVVSGNSHSVLSSDKGLGQGGLGGDDVDGGTQERWGHDA